MTQRRDFDALSEAQIAAGRTQKRWVEPKAQFRPAAPQAVTELLDMIQHVAEAATGERSFLHLRPGPDPRPVSAIGASWGAGGSHRAGSKP